MVLPADIEHARSLDRQDELARFQGEFVVDDPELIYLDGNSLGRLSHRSIARLQQVIHLEWGQRLIRAWNEGWIDLASRIGDKIARLVGAAPGEVILADSTSVNLFKAVVAVLQTQAGRQVILTDDLNFPSDLYILQGIIRLLGNQHRLRILPSPDGVHGPVDALVEAIDSNTALVTLSHTAFKSAYTYDLDAITTAAHTHGAMVLWDLSHSAGAMPIHLHAAKVDLAVGCTYKYLNGGPGAPAFLYVRKDLQDGLLNPISGWFGQNRPFDFELEYRPVAGLQRFLSGTPPVLSLAAIEPSVDTLLEAGIDRVRAKSVRQTEYLIALWEAQLQDLGFHLRSPRNPTWRGSHVSLSHQEGLRIDLALIRDMKVLPDYREPGIIRLGIAPLYTRYVDILEGVQRLRTVVVNRYYERYPAQRPEVT